MIRNILVPLDGSRSSGSVLPYVRMLARATDAKATLVTAAPPGRESQRRSLMTYLKKAAAWVRQGRNRRVDCEIITGDPAEAIPEYALSRRVDLIALCSSGRKGLRRLMEGSVTESIMRSVAVPVLAVNPLQEGEKPKKFEKIVVPLDGSHRSSAILEHAAELARDLDARLVLLRVVEASPRRDGVPVRTALQNLFAQHKGLQSLKLAVDIHMLHGRPADAILSFAEANHADLLALSTHGRSGLDRVLFGSVAEQLLRRGRLPMLVVRSAGIPRGHAVSGSAGRSRRAALEFVRSAGGAPRAY